MRALGVLAMVAALASGPARAACSDEVAAFEASLGKEARSAGAALSAGQATAAERGGKAAEAASGGMDVTDLAKPPAPDNAEATRSAARTGGGEGVMSAKVSLNDACNAAKKGDERGCVAALAKARDQARR